MGLSILLALVNESVCRFGLLVIVGGQERAKHTTLSAPEWFGKWLTERAEPGTGLGAEFSELRADFAAWARRSPALRPRHFRKLLGAACAELGLDMDGDRVGGLRLLPMIG